MLAVAVAAPIPALTRLAGPAGAAVEVILGMERRELLTLAVVAVVHMV